MVDMLDNDSIHHNRNKISEVIGTMMIESTLCQLGIGANERTSAARMARWEVGNIDRELHKP